MKLSEGQRCRLIQRYYNGESVAEICLEASISKSTFYGWLKPYQITRTGTGDAISAKEFARIKRYITKLEQKVEILQKVNCTVSSPLRERLNELTLLHDQYNVHVLCEALKVDRGTFYNHILRNKRENNSYQFRRNQLSEQIKQAYEESNQIYGARKIKAILGGRGIAVSDRMVAALMREMNLHSIRNGAKEDYLKFNYEKKKDALKMNFSVKAPNQVWVSDVTYFKLDGKFQYICAIIDLYSRKVIAYKISQKHSTQLITATFKLAYAARKPEAGLIFHSDRGAQYLSHTFRRLLKTCHITQSFSPSGSTA